MLVTKIIVALIIAITTIGVLAVYTEEWANRLQKYFTNVAKRTNGDIQKWEKPRIRLLFMVMIVIWGTVVALLLFAALEGPVHFACDAACQEQWLQKN